MSSAVLQRVGNNGHVQSTALVTTGAQMQIAMPIGYQEAMSIGKIFAESGLFKDVKSVAQCAVKIMAGAEMGMQPFAAMNAFHIIEGKATLTAQTIAAFIKRSGRYNYRIKQWDNKGCAIAFFEAGEEIGEASFLEADAKAAKLFGKDNWVKYPDAMYFSRAISKGARAYCPDVFGGAVYTAEELGVDVDAEGNPTRAAIAAATPAPLPAPTALVSVPPVAVSAPTDEQIATWRAAGRIAGGKYAGKFPKDVPSPYLEKLIPVLQGSAPDARILKAVQAELERRYARNDGLGDATAAAANYAPTAWPDDAPDAAQLPLDAPIEAEVVEQPADNSQPFHIKQVWAAIHKAGLPALEGEPARQRRIQATNQLLIGHGIGAIDSFGQLSERACGLLIAAIEGGALTWE